MGCRLHWASVYKIDWTGGWFNWNAEVIREVFRHLGIEVWECTNEGDDYDDFELSVDEFNELKEIIASHRGADDYEQPIMTVAQLKDAGVFDDEQLYCPSYKNMDDWAKEVDSSYDKDNSYIRFSWF